MFSSLNLNRMKKKLSTNDRRHVNRHTSEVWICRALTVSWTLLMMWANGIAKYRFAHCEDASHSNSWNCKLHFVCLFAVTRLMFVRNETIKILFSVHRSSSCDFVLRKSKSIFSCYTQSIRAHSTCQFSFPRSIESKFDKDVSRNVALTNKCSVTCAKRESESEHKKKNY